MLQRVCFDKDNYLSDLFKLPTGPSSLLCQRPLPQIWSTSRDGVGDGELWAFVRDPEVDEV